MSTPSELEERLLTALEEIYDRAMNVDQVIPGLRYVAKALVPYVEGLYESETQR